MIYELHLTFNCAKTLYRSHVYTNQPSIQPCLVQIIQHKPHNFIPNQHKEIFTLKVLIEPQSGILSKRNTKNIFIINDDAYYNSSLQKTVGCDFTYCVNKITYNATLREKNMDRLHLFWIYQRTHKLPIELVRIVNEYLSISKRVSWKSVRNVLKSAYCEANAKLD